MIPCAKRRCPARGWTVRSRLRMRFCTRDICCIPTARARPRTRCGGSSACSDRRERPASSESPARCTPTCCYAAAPPRRSPCTCASCNCSTARSREPPSDRDFVDVDELRTGGQRWLSWDEAVPHELTFGPFDLSIDRTATVDVNGGTEVENLRDADGQVVGRLERRRHALSADLHLAPQQLAGNLHRVGLTVANTGRVPRRRRERVRPCRCSAPTCWSRPTPPRSSRFSSRTTMPLRPRPGAGRTAAGPCSPPPGDDLVLVSPIILYDHPEIAPESAGELYDATEIDEILSLRVHDDDRRGEGGGAGHRSARGRDHRPLRRDVAGDCSATARAPA